MTDPRVVASIAIASFAVLGGFAGYAYYGIGWQVGTALGLAVGIVYGAWYLRRGVDR